MATIEAADPDGRPPRGPRSSAATRFILALLVFHTVYVAAELVLPFLLAFLGALTLTPLVRLLERAHVRRSIGGGLVLASLIAGLGAGAQLLVEPAAAWADRVPEMARELERKLYFMRRPMEDLEEAADSVKRLATPGSGDPQEVVAVQGDSLLGTLLTGTRAFLTTGVVTLVLLYFLITAGPALVEQMARVLAHRRGHPNALEILRAVEGEVSHYLLVMCAINTVLGCAAALALYMLSVPNALLWGVVTACANFIPFLGSLCVAVLLTGVAVVTFEDWGRILLVPGVFTLLTSLEGLVITPAIMGRSFQLNPVFVVSAILAASWLWGIVGALVAVPLLVTLKLAGLRLPALRPVARVLSA